MSLLLTIWLYIFLGSLSELVVTLHYRFMILRRAGLTTACSILCDLMAYFIIGTIVVEHKYFLILAYVVGKGIGTYAGMKINLEKDHE